eukprot:TCALIF_13270-PA protein Name:"Protein of unknown function" AED:0.33 eAED:0.37 QI:0/-1/0/1/-1/1/1/0/387
MEPKNMVCNICWILLLKTLGNFETLDALIAPSNLVCAAICAHNLDCQGHQFDSEAVLDNCVLILNAQAFANYAETIWSKTFRVQSGLVGQSRYSQRVPPTKAALLAKTSGFNIELRLSDHRVFLKRVIQSQTILEAQDTCLRQGGILPMENSEDFISQMNALVGDSTSTRFTSLAREMAEDPDTPHLVWHAGKVESTEVGLSFPKYTTWDKHFFMINPATASYESVESSTEKPEFYCQFLGKNLALNKEAYGSSKHSHKDSGPGVVDGVLNQKLWHSKPYSSVKPDWFAIDLNQTSVISRILFLGRDDCCGERNRFIKAWVGNVAPPSGQSLNITSYQMCGEYPYIQNTTWLSGIECGAPMLGKVVVLENGDVSPQYPMQLREVLIF